MNKNTITNLLGAIAIGALVSSCSVAQKYTRPELNIPVQYKSDISLTGDRVQLPWRTFFKDPQLIALIEKALHNNNDVAVALKTIDQLDLAMKQAKLSILPTAQATIGANRSYPSKNSMNGSMAEQFIGTKYIDDYTLNLGISWEADIWGKTKLRKDQSIADYFGQKENVVALKTRIIVQVAQAYYNLISLDQQLKIAYENVKLSEDILRMMRLQYNSGQVNSLAIEQAEAQKKTAELIIPLAKQNISIQESALSILCGEYPDSISRAESLKSVTPEEIYGSGVPAELLSRRPDLKAAEYAVISLNAKTGLAKTAMYPSISLSAQVGANAFKFNKWFDLPGSITKNLAANLTQPIFQKKELQTAYKTAVIEQEKAAIQFKQAVMTAVGEVSNAMANYKGSTERLNLLSKKGESLDKATKDATLLYKNGMATYLEVISAQSAKLQNELEQNTIELDRLNSMVELYRALGGATDSI
ncbi:efflux transporter outer membrane subunit [Elizabethkingia anophelis]|uniref:efflux transporter outer membrane subunit n=1 Tax=Elizabethkingia anophelis TaxID=1117645 RepID=UPI0038914876